MNVLELEIINMRGIRHVNLKPNGKNFVVWGPNGSGKSAVVDAIDFLLTGRITRLTGRGTGDITLSKHGPHIDCDPKDATVRAVIQVKGFKDPFEITRCIAQPGILKCKDEIKPHLNSIIALARRGQHVLTRREILRYITAEGSTRAEDIQELLNITEIEEIRKALIKTQNSLAKDFQAVKRNLDSVKSIVNATIHEHSYIPEKVLEVVNRNRAIIGASPITNLHSTQLKANTKLPAASLKDRPINVTLLESDIENIQKILSDDSQYEISENNDKLRSFIKKVKADPSLAKAYSQKQLISIGLTLIDETGNCPLCDTPWENGELHNHLERKLSSAKTADQLYNDIIASSGIINKHLSAIQANLAKVTAAAELMGLSEEIESFKKWKIRLQVFSDAIVSPIDKYHTIEPGLYSIQSLFAPTNLSEICTKIATAVKSKFPEATPEQTAWDTLTRLEENLKSIERTEEDYRLAEASQKRATLLVECFQKARDNQLKKIYDSIKDRFVALYKELHGSDENGFDARLEPDGASLNFEVGFYDRGTHPPHALHSEGHQDSMGLCLYLALEEKLTEGLIDLLILDDVVMSVDSDHRRQLCRLIAKEFPQRQFLITTHDKTWANQLKTEGIVNTASSIEFYNWNVEAGPQVSSEEIVWDKIAQDVSNGDISSAAARLRRGSEHFFAMVCDSLQASVIFKLNSRWELGDYLPAAISQYRSLLKKAKIAAQSWKDTEAIKMFSELESTSGQIYSRTNVEQWVINASVHYNNWANLSPQDFIPVVESFQDLFRVFICSNCNSMIYVAKNGIKIVNVKCRCGKVNWNLEGK